MLKNQDKSFQKIITCLNNHQIIAFQTDTIPGLAVHAYSFQAIQKLTKLKNRPQNKSFIWIVDSITRLNHLPIKFTQNSKRLMKKYWPGSVTFIFPLQYPPNLFHKPQNIAIRIPKNPYLLQLIQKLKAPLLMTSANLSGEKPCLSINEIKQIFHNQIAFYDTFSNQQIIIKNQPSTIVKLTSHRSIIIRKGSL